jgi:hypothetical protein
MILRLLFLLQLSLLPLWGLCAEKHYTLTADPIDVVIPCAEKDVSTLSACIRGIKQNGVGVRRIIVVSKTRLTDEAEWFDEARYPFSKWDVTQLIYGSEEEAYRCRNEWDRIGWVLQQLLKLYSPLVIPGISSNVLVLDADAIFLNPVHFLNEGNGALFNTGGEWYEPYFIHGAKLIPGFKRLYPEHSGITHHMLLQKSIIEDLFQTVESTHHTEMWRAYCQSIERANLYYAACSEYELYFNYALSQTSQVQIRKLKWDNTSYLSQIKNYQILGYHYVAAHTWERRD